MKCCPKCGSKRIAPTLYGMPAFDDEMERKIADREIYLSGCRISHADPSRHCFACGKDVGSQPLFLSKYGDKETLIEDYRDSVVSVRFNKIAARGGDDELMIMRMPTGEYISDYRPWIERGIEPVRRTVSESEWRMLMDTLYQRLYLHEWPKRFYPPKGVVVLDGESWELELRLTHRRVRNYCGENGYPAYWDGLVRALERFMR